jgi:hypothetical protein
MALVAGVDRDLADGQAGVEVAARQLPNALVVDRLVVPADQDVVVGEPGQALMQRAPLVLLAEALGRAAAAAAAAIIRSKSPKRSGVRPSSMQRWKTKRRTRSTA